MYTSLSLYVYIYMCVYIYIYIYIHRTLTKCKIFLGAFYPDNLVGEHVVERSAVSAPAI